VDSCADAVAPETAVVAAAGAGKAAPSAKPDCYMLIANFTKRANVGTLMRSCVAFGVKKMLVCGAGKFATFGAKGTERFIETEHVGKVKDAVAALKAQGVTICGIEITPDAQPVHRHPFRGPTAFLAGSEGEGLCDAHKAMCDHFVFIPQVGNGTASLNVAIATSIVLHHFSVWAGYEELPRDAGGRDKFLLVSPEPDGPETARAAQRRAAKASSRADNAAAAEDALDAGLGFDADFDGGSEDDEGGESSRR